MTVEVVPFENLPKLMAELEALALSNEDVVFRGHTDETWKIKSTLARYTPVPHRSWDSHIDEMLSHFIVNALSIAYVALYFAFAGIQYRPGAAPPGNAAVFALNILELGTCWARFLGRDFHEEFNRFTHENTNIFQHGYPAGELKFMRFPASWNARMQRQLGCFIYDTLDYSGAGVGHGSFEGFIDSFEEPEAPDGKRHPTLIKYIVPRSEARSVFSRLELMNINGTKLIDIQGLADDVKNSYNYTRKAGYAWDIVLPPPDDTKM